MASTSSCFKCFCPYCQQYFASSSKYFCGVCLVSISGRCNYIQHVQGKTHVMKTNLLQKPPSTTGLMCHTCLVAFTGEESALQHYSSLKHTENESIVNELGNSFWITRTVSALGLQIGPCGGIEGHLPTTDENTSEDQPISR